MISRTFFEFINILWFLEYFSQKLQPFVIWKSWINLKKKKQKQKWEKKRKKIGASRPTGRPWTRMWEGGRVWEKLLLAPRHKRTFQKLPKSKTWKTFESTTIFSNRQTFVLKFWAVFKCINICFVKTNIFWNAWVVFEFMNICFVQTNIFWNACIVFEFMNNFWVSKPFCINDFFSNWGTNFEKLWFFYNLRTVL